MMLASSLALITGVCGGVGRALVQAISQRGYRVSAMDQAPQPVGLACWHYVQADLQRWVQEPAYDEKVMTLTTQALGDEGLPELVNNAAAQSVDEAELCGLRHQQGGPQRHDPCDGG
jgi:NAD(P)-dependent dehydrogenase (short-subunit alcohol dehydrogenase family)